MRVTSAALTICWGFGAISAAAQQSPTNAPTAAADSKKPVAGTKYRLVLFPSYMSAVGYSASFDIDWTLTDVATAKVIWVFSTTTWYGAFAGPKLTGTIDNAMASLKKSGLIS